MLAARSLLCTQGGGRKRLPPSFSRLRQATSSRSGREPPKEPKNLLFPELQAERDAAERVNAKAACWSSWAIVFLQPALDENYRRVDASAYAWPGADGETKA